jgi:hypothetical protein
VRTARPAASQGSDGTLLCVTAAGVLVLCETVPGPAGWPGSSPDLQLWPVLLVGRPPGRAGFVAAARRRLRPDRP